MKGDIWNVDIVDEHGHQSLQPQPSTPWPNPRYHSLAFDTAWTPSTWQVDDFPKWNN